MTSAVATSSPCPVCGSDSGRVLLRAEVLPERQAVLRCGSCDLVYFEGLEREKRELEESRAYWLKPEQREIYEAPAVSEAVAQRAGRRLESIERFAAPGRLLDVGCGTGQFLQVAEGRGWETYGLDISEESCAVLRSRLGERVHCGEMRAGLYPAGFFDAVTLWDVVEHLTDPLGTVEAIQAALRPGGVLAILTPDESGSFKRLARFLWRASFGLVRFPLRYVYYHPHFVSFSPRALRSLLERAGLGIVREERELTELSFARLKIRHHYPSGFRRGAVLLALQILEASGAERWLSNKLVVYARKLPS